MSLGEIAKIALIDTALGMGTVFMILVLISILIWALGRIVGGTGKKGKTKRISGRKADAPDIPGGDAAMIQGSESGIIQKAGTGKDAVPAINADGLTPELVAAIATVAINKHLRDQRAAASADEYVVRNIRRSTWRRT